MQHLHKNIFKNIVIYIHESFFNFFCVCETETLVVVSMYIFPLVICLQDKVEHTKKYVGNILPKKIHIHQVCR